MELLIEAGGIYCIGFVLFHLLFRRIFNWDEDLRSLSGLNRAIMPVLNYSLTFVFVIFSCISLFHARELLESPLGHSLLALISLFWLLRAIEQVISFKLRHWASALFLVIFVTGAVLYGIPTASVL